MSAPGRGPQETSAHQYADAGWPVFPCREGSKQPATQHGFQDATTSHAQIGRWWSAAPERNVAVATGAPGPDVVDVDNHGELGNGYGAWNKLREAGVLGQPQAIVGTPSGGMHAYYPGTAQGNGSIRGQHLDFRGKGGYVVAPPSRVGGRAYEVNGHQRPDLVRPVDWSAVRDTLAPPPPRAQAAPYPQGDPGKSLDRLVNWVAQREPGDRNFSLFWAAKQAEIAGALDGNGVERLVDAARRNGLKGGEPEARRTIESGRQAAQRGPAPARPVTARHAGQEAAPRPFAPAPQPQLQAGE